MCCRIACFKEPPASWKSIQPIPQIVEWPLLPYTPGHFLHDFLQHDDGDHEANETLERLRIRVPGSVVEIVLLR